MLIRSADPTLSEASGTIPGMDILHVDCNDCAVRGSGCSDCVISVLLGVPDGLGTSVDLAGDERRALAALAGGGLVPPLRLVNGHTPVHQAEEQPCLDARFAE